MNIVKCRKRLREHLRTRVQHLMCYSFFQHVLLEQFSKTVPILRLYGVFENNQVL